MSKKKKAKQAGNQMNPRTLIACLDIGTSKIAVIIGAIKQDGTMEIVGAGTHKSSGIRDGVVERPQPPIFSPELSPMNRMGQNGDVRDGRKVAA